MHSHRDPVPLAQELDQLHETKEAEKVDRDHFATRLQMINAYPNIFAQSNITSDIFVPARQSTRKPERIKFCIKGEG